MATAWPGVVSWLLTTLPTLPGWSSVDIIDGAPLESTPAADYVTVGFVDGSAGDNTFTLTADPDGFSVEESGSVRCRLVSVTEQSEALAAVRARVFTIFDALADAVKADRRLGNTLSPQGTATITADAQSITNNTGSAVALMFSLTYTTVT